MKENEFVARRQGQRDAAFIHGPNASIHRKSAVAAALCRPTPNVLETLGFLHKLFSKFPRRIIAFPGV